MFFFQCYPVDFFNFMLFTPYLFDGQVSLLMPVSSHDAAWSNFMLQSLKRFHSTHDKIS